MISHTTIYIFIYIQIIEKINTLSLETELYYQKAKRIRNNIVNKSLWTRNSLDDTFANHGTYIRQNTLDVERQPQNYDSFKGPYLSDYIQRQKRNGKSIHQKRHRRDMSDKFDIGRKLSDYDNTDSEQLKLIDSLTMIDDYPFEVAIYLNNNKDNNNTVTHNNSVPNSNANMAIDTEMKDNTNDPKKNGTTKKRSMQYDFETEVIKHFEVSDNLNRTESNRDREAILDNKGNRNVFDKTNSEWHQTAPIPDVNVYRVVPKEPAPKSKPVTERGLIKVISMLTKSFKKIMKQHTEITNVHAKINEINEDFTKTAALIATKFQDFDLKYIYLIKLQETLKDFTAKLESQEQYFKNKEKEISGTFLEFENQQKKFLQQQKQFYSMQKLMLAQNEKINMKQSLIARTQSEISHRQNNFARILRKAKQLYVERRKTDRQQQYDVYKPKITPKPHFEQRPDPTTQISELKDPIKINLFAVPSYNRVQKDPDELILREKDDQSIDDLVYKYYFNNTFIDSIMEKHVLNTFIGGPKNTGKNKRDEGDNTILQPLLSGSQETSDEFEENNRIRRWINHHAKHNRRNDRGKIPLAVSVNSTDSKKNKGVSTDYFDTPLIRPVRNNVDNHFSNDPFLMMAMNFCKEIGQNLNNQSLSWCVEKTLRRLQFLEPKFQSQPPPTQVTLATTKPPKQHVKDIFSYESAEKTDSKEKTESMEKTESLETQGTDRPTTLKQESTTTRMPATTTEPPRVLITSTLKITKTPYVHPPITKKKKGSSRLNFPDNDALEYNIERILSDLPPEDLEGNVYFEGSAHESDILEQEM